MNNIGNTSHDDNATTNHCMRSVQKYIHDNDCLLKKNKFIQYISQLLINNNKKNCLRTKCQSSLLVLFKYV